MSTYKQLDILQRKGYHQAGNLDTWEALVRADSSLGFRLLKQAIELENLDENVLLHTFQGLAESREASEAFIREFTNTFARLPKVVMGQVIHPVARTIEYIVANSASDLTQEVLALWDLGFSSALEKTSGVDGGDATTFALNHPAGRLAEGLLERLRSSLKPNEQHIPESYRIRFETALGSISDLIGINHGYRAARIMVCLRLSWLHWLDKDWAEEKIIPLLGWTDPGVSADMWAAFLWAPSISPNLWTVIRPHFMGAFEQFERLGRRRSRLAENLVSAFVEGYPITNEEVRDSLRLSGEPGMEAAAHYLLELLSGADERSESLWRNRIGPFLRDCWPMEISLRNPEQSTHLALASIYSGKAFPDAVAIVVQLLVPQEHPYKIIKELGKSTQPVEFPEETLKLLNAVVAERVGTLGTDLDNILRKVSENGVNVNSSPAGRRLKDIAAAGT